MHFIVVFQKAGLARFGKVTFNTPVFRCFMVSQVHKEQLPN